MSVTPDNPPDNEGDGEEDAQDCNLFNNPNKKSQGVDIDDPDKDHIEPYQDVTKPLHDISEPSTSNKIQKCGVEGKDIKNDIKIKNGEQGTKVKNRECGIKIKDADAASNETGGSIMGIEVTARENEIWAVTPEVVTVSMKKLFEAKDSLSLEEIASYIIRHHSKQADKVILKSKLAEQFHGACFCGLLTEENGRYKLPNYHDELHLKNSDVKQFLNKRNIINTIDEGRSESSENKSKRSRCLKTRGMKRKQNSVTDLSPLPRKRKCAPLKRKKHRRKNLPSCPQPSTTQDVSTSAANNQPM